MRAVPPPPEAEPPSLERIVEGLRYARSAARADGHLRRRHRRHVLRHADGALPGRGQPPGRRGRARAALRRSGGGLAARDADERLGGPRAPPRRRGHASRRRCGASASSASAWRPNLALALLGLVVAGGADMLSGIFRGTIWNQTIPDHLRGRLAGIEQVSYSTGPLLGNVESGAVASLAGVRASIVSGGVLCVAGVAVAALALPAFWRYDARRELAGAWHRYAGAGSGTGSRSMPGDAVGVGLVQRLVLEQRPGERLELVAVRLELGDRGRARTPRRSGAPPRPPARGCAPTASPAPGEQGRLVVRAGQHRHRADALGHAPAARPSGGRSG